MRFELGSERLLPRWVVTFFVGGAVVLIPWIVLMFTVPQVVNVTRRWELLWGGFDCFLVLGFAVTAFRLITRSPRGAVTAAMTGTMLLIDAWFDVLTTHRGGQVISILMAVFAEIPCALICFYVSRRIVGLFEQAKEVLGSAGFLVRGSQLVPPANFPTPTAAPDASVAASAAPADNLPPAGPSGIPTPTAPVGFPTPTASAAQPDAPIPTPAVPAAQLDASVPVSAARAGVPTPAVPAAQPDASVLVSAVPASVSTPASETVPAEPIPASAAADPEPVLKPVLAAAPTLTVVSGSTPPTAPIINTSTAATPSGASISSAFSSEVPTGHDVSSTSIVASRNLAA